jgi:hypothetical protein
MKTMEDLNKTQIVLLCVLVSFVVSIATGIITTALLQDAPQLTRSITRVVQRTGDADETSNEDQSPRQEVIVGADEQISRILASMRAYRVEIVGGVGTSHLGIIKNNREVIAPATTDDIDEQYSVRRLEKGKIQQLAARTENASLGLFATSAPVWSVDGLPVAKPDELRLGQTVIAIDGIDGERVSVGRISQFNTRADDVAVINTDIERQLTDGAILVGMDGAVIGMHTQMTESGQFVPLTAVPEHGQAGGATPMRNDGPVPASQTVPTDATSATRTATTSVN